MHVNQQVREAIKAKLLNTGAFAMVATNRGANLEEVDLPAAIITTTSDDITTETKDEPIPERRIIRVSVVIVADAAMEDLDDRMDDLRVEVEKALAGDLDGIAFRVEHAGATLEVGTDEEGQHWFAFYALEWEVELWTRQGQPDEVWR